MLHDHSGYNPTEKKRFCNGAALYTAKGQLVDKVDGLNATQCATRVTDDGRLELLAVKQGSLFSGDTITVYRAGVQVASFDGDNRPVDESKQHGKTVQWLGKTPYAVSYAGIPRSPRLLDVNQGKVLCDLSTASQSNSTLDPWMNAGVLLADSAGGIYVNNPAQRLHLPGCQLQRVSAGNEVLSIDGEMAYLHDRQSGRLDIIDIPSWKIRHTIQESIKLPHDPDLRQTIGWWRVPGNPKILVGHATIYKLKEPNLETRSIFVSLESGAVRSGLLPFNNVANGYLRSYEIGKRSRYWKIDFQDAPQAQAFIASLQKDKFESTAEYKARVAGLALPYRLNVALHDYDADAGAFSASWNGAPIRLPLAPTDARLFAQARSIEVQGDLAWLDGDFLELRNPSVTAPDGRRIALQVATGAAPVVNKPVANIPAAEGAALPQAATANAPPGSPAKAVNAAANPVSVPVTDLGGDCTTAERRGMAQIEEIKQRALRDRPGACEAARLNRRVGEIGLSVYTVCNSQEGIDAMKKMIRETDATIRGVCS